MQTANILNKNKKKKWQKVNKLFLQSQSICVVNLWFIYNAKKMLCGPI